MEPLVSLPMSSCDDLSIRNQCGIYAIIQRSSGRKYVGSSNDIRKRAKEHRRILRLKEHHSRYLQRAWDKYTEADFYLEIVEITPASELLNREQFYILNWKTTNHLHGFNMAIPFAAEQATIKRTPERLGQLSRAMKKRWAKNPSLMTYGIHSPEAQKSRAYLASKRWANMTPENQQEFLKARILRPDVVAARIKNFKGSATDRALAKCREAKTKRTTWIHDVHGEFFGSGPEIRDAFKLDNYRPSVLSKVRLGQRPQYRGWRLKR